MLKHREVTRVERSSWVVIIIQVDHGFADHCRPVGDIPLGERTMVHRNIEIVFFLEGCKLDIAIDCTLVAPHHRIGDGSRLADVDTAGTAVAHTIINHVRANTLVVDDRQVVQRATVVQVHTRTLGVTGTVGDKRSLGKRTIYRCLEVFVIFICIVERGVCLRSCLLGILVRVMADSQTGTRTGRTLRDIAVLHLAIVVDAHTASIALLHTEARGLTSVDIAVVDVTAAVQIDRTTTLSG